MFPVTLNYPNLKCQYISLQFHRVVACRPNRPSLDFNKKKIGDTAMARKDKYLRVITPKPDFIAIGVSRGGGVQGVLTPLFICDPPPPTQPDLTDKCNVNCFLIV